MSKIQYKQYEIQASPYIRIIDGIQKWAGQYIIRRHMGAKVVSKRAPLKETFETKEEAIKFSIVAGKVKIDEKLL